MSFLKLENINKSYNGIKILEDINLEFNLNEIVFIVGESGCGKSTLLNCIGLLDCVDSGKIYINQKQVRGNLSRYRYNYFSYIFQEHNLVDYLSIKDNIELVSKNDNYVKELSLRLDIEECLNKKASSLSQGEKSRCSTLRGLCTYPKILLCDEPTGSLDEENGKNLMDLLERNSEGKLIIIASHDLELANKYGNKIIKITNGKAEIIKDESNSKVDYSEPNIAYNEYPVKKAFKNTLSYFRNNKKFISIMSIILIIFFSILSIGIGLYEGLKGYKDYEINNRLDSKYYEIERVEDSASITDSTVLLPLRQNNIIYKEYDNLGYIFNYFIKNQFSYCNNINDEFEFCIIDFEYVSSLNIDLYNTKPNAIVNNQFTNLINNNNLSLNYKITFLDYSKELIWDFNIDGVSNESSLFNKPKIYLNYKFAKDLLGEDLYTYIFKEQNEVKLPKYILTLTGIKATNKVLEKQENYYSLLSLDIPGEATIYTSNNLILSTTFDNLINSIFYIVILVVILLSFTLIGLMILVLTYVFNKRSKEYSLLLAFGQDYKTIFKQMLVQTTIIFLPSLIISLIIYFICSRYSNLLLSSVLKYTYDYKMIQFDIKSLISTVYVFLVFLFLSTLSQYKLINKESISKEFKHE